MYVLRSLFHVIGLDIFVMLYLVVFCQLANPNQLEITQGLDILIHINKGKRKKVILIADQLNLLSLPTFFPFYACIRRNFYRSNDEY